MPARASTPPLEAAELRAALRDFDLVLPTLGDLFSAQVFADVPQPRARLLANFGVGYNHIDVAAARAAGIAVTNTPGAVTDATADIEEIIDAGELGDSGTVAVVRGTQYRVISHQPDGQGFSVLILTQEA